MTFVEALAATHPYYVVRLLGGLLVLSGMFIMAYNVRRTIAEAPAFANAPVLAAAH